MAELWDSILFIFQRLTWSSVVDLFLVTMIFFALLVFLRDTRAMVLLRGVLLLYALIGLLTTALRLPAFSWLVSNTLPVLLLAIPVIFAPEIRRALERLGRAGRLLPAGRRNTKTPDVTSAVVHAAKRLSDRRHGALIVLQRLDSLDEYVETGVRMEARVSAELLLQIFFPNTPLHDGGVIINDRRILGAGCVMPLSASGVLTGQPERKMGLRHRAALGASEVSDAVVIVVSEETGAISIAYGGRMIHRLDSERLEGVLRAFYKPEEKTSVEEYASRLLSFLDRGQEDRLEV